MRICKVCGAPEDKAKWVVRKGRNNGATCYACRYARLYKEHASTIKARVAAYRKKNSEKTKGAVAAWHAKNPGMNTFYSRRYQLDKVQRTPVWADQEVIQKLYAKAAELTKTTGIAHHIDHVVPLRGRLVSGLHVENNLQILTESENCSKHNTYEIA